MEILPCIITHLCEVSAVSSSAYNLKNTKERFCNRWLYLGIQSTPCPGLSHLPEVPFKESEKYINIAYIPTPGWSESRTVYQSQFILQPEFKSF